MRSSFPIRSLPLYIRRPFLSISSFKSTHYECFNKNRFSFSTVSFSRNALLFASMLLLWAIVGSTFDINLEKRTQFVYHSFSKKQVRRQRHSSLSEFVAKPRNEFASSFESWLGTDQAIFYIDGIAYST